RKVNNKTAASGHSIHTAMLLKHLFEFLFELLEESTSSVFLLLFFGNIARLFFGLVAKVLADSIISMVIVISRGFSWFGSSRLRSRIFSLMWPCQATVSLGI